MELSGQNSCTVEVTLCVIFIAGLLVPLLCETVIIQSFIQLLFPISGKLEGGSCLKGGKILIKAASNWHSHSDSEY